MELVDLSIMVKRVKPACRFLPAVAVTAFIGTHMPQDKVTAFGYAHTSTAADLSTGYAAETHSDQSCLKPSHVRVFCILAIDLLWQTDPTSADVLRRLFRATDSER